MHSRVAVLGFGLLLVTAGCLSSAPASDRNPGTTSASTPVQTTRPDSSNDTRLTERSLPERPENLTRENVVGFVENYEQAYKWNEELTNGTTELAITPARTKILNVTATGFVVHLEVGFSKTLRRDGSEMSGGGFYTVNYFVNETVMLRAQTGGQVRPGPNPRNGTVVEA